MSNDISPQEVLKRAKTDKLAKVSLLSEDAKRATIRISGLEGYEDKPFDISVSKADTVNRWLLLEVGVKPTYKLYK